LGVVTVAALLSSECFPDASLASGNLHLGRKLRPSALGESSGPGRPAGRPPESAPAGHPPPCSEKRVSGPLELRLILARRATNMQHVGTDPAAGGFRASSGEPIAMWWIS